MKHSPDLPDEGLLDGDVEGEGTGGRRVPGGREENGGGTLFKKVPDNYLKHYKLQLRTE